MFETESSTKFITALIQLNILIYNFFWKFITDFSLFKIYILKYLL